MKILTRYLLGEMVVPFLIGQCAIVLMLIGSVLYNNANLFLQFQVPVVYVVRLSLYYVPFLVHMTMPVAMAVAASLAVSRMARDSEITVIRASGVSLTRLFWTIFMLGLVVSIGDFYFGETVVPAAINRYLMVMEELPNHLPRLTPAQGQLFVSSDQQYAIGVKTMISHHGYIELHGVQIIATMRLFNGPSQPFVAASASGRYQDGKWILDHAIIFTYNPNNPSFYSVARATSPTTYTIPVDPQSFQSSFLLQMPMGQMASNATRTLAQLGQELKQNSQRHFTDYSVLLDYHFKLSVPFSCLVMAICCPPLALRYGKGGGFMGTLLSICLVFVYWNTLLLARILGTPGPDGGAPLLAPAVAAWSQNVLFILLGLIVLKRSE